MRGKIVFILGLGAGYVLGARAGRERYEQIKEQAQKLWELAPVQKQVDKAKDLGRSAMMAIPGAIWEGAVKVTKAAASRGTAGQRLDAVIAAGEDAASDVSDAVEETKTAASSARTSTTSKKASGSRSGSSSSKARTTAKKTTTSAKKRSGEGDA